MDDNARYIAIFALNTLWNMAGFGAFIYLVGWCGWSVWWLIIPLILYKGVEYRKVN